MLNIKNYLFSQFCVNEFCMWYHLIFLILYDYLLNRMKYNIFLEVKGQIRSMRKTNIISEAANFTKYA